VTAVILILVVAAVLYGWYAAIVQRRNRVGEALAGIDVQLAQRHDLIPNLLAVAKRFMAHEHDLLEEITRLRAEGARAIGATGPAAVAQKFEAEERLGADLQRLFAVAEAYPDLKSQAPMIEAQRGLSEVETNIAAARRFYNSAVGQLRNAIQIFPGTLLAGLAGAGTPPPFFEAEAQQRRAIDAAAHL
jgi:LemA protein